MIASVLLDQPSNKSDNIYKDVTSCLHLVPNLLTTWNKKCELTQLVEILTCTTTTCEILTCVQYNQFFRVPKVRNHPAPFQTNKLTNKLSNFLQYIFLIANKLSDCVRKKDMNYISKLKLLEINQQWPPSQALS